MPKVSVIVPIYNVEKYIERCVRSLMEQTMNDLEFILVNDASTDCSMDIVSRTIEEYPLRKPLIKIINQEHNQGVAVARTIGMKVATGEYQIHCDADDWIETNMYELLYNKAIESGADIVICDFTHHFISYTREENVTNIYNFKNDADKLPVSYWWSFGNTMIKSNIVRDYHIYPIEDINITEDLNTIMRVFYYANKIDYVHEKLYHYNRINERSYLHGNVVRNCLNKCSSIDYLWNFFLNMDDTINIRRYLKRLHIHARDSILKINLSNYEWSLWKKALPITTSFVIQDKSLPIVYRIVYFIASKGFFLPFKIYIKLSSLKNQQH